ncbi:helix-turn-helix transcriptional regulator [Brevibacterium spongiae]|uniref:WYL domain-containing protein n=1 Tax=Brevibacterium spongiae TaxID=2909672 RepID=A0ABY5SYQ7_9MICO|nr:WYL domain-containing protein [Brevibacterium spongiae]UVI37834.1 WYL domain-containing protein [Brevibacterium spongiae]
MKSARLVSEIVILAARTSPITAAALARRLEVTERTVYRDLTDLSLIGVPVLTQSGPGGGISLLGDWSSPVSGLTRDEVDSVLVGSSAAGDLGLSAELASAREKILAETASAFSRHILVDGPDWFMAKEDPHALSTIVGALRSGRGLNIVYERQGRARPRTLIPLGLVVKAGRWYLAAQAPGGVPRTYRVARIRSAEPTYLRVTAPPQFRLGEYWEVSQEEFDRSMRTVMVRLRLPRTRADDLRRAVPGRLTEAALAGARVSGEDMEIELPMEPAEVAVSQLITVPDLTVVSPMHIRRGLRDQARAAAERNR